MKPVNIRPFRPDDAEALLAAAHADKHEVYFPSLVLEKAGKIVGYFSVAVPVVLSWQDSKQMQAVDSLKELGFIEGALAQSPFICIPCDPESPFATTGFLEKNGYVKYTKPVELYLKIK